MSPSGADVRKTRLSKALPLFLSALVAAVVLWWLFETVSFREVTGLIVRCHRGALLVFFALSLGTSFFRMWRYQLLLASDGFRVKGSRLFLVVLVRNFFADLLPARLGSLIYVFLITTRLGVPLEAASSSFGLAFFFDLLGLAPLLLYAAWGADITPGVLALLGVATGLASVLLILKLDRLLLLVSAPVRRFAAHASAARIVRFLDETAKMVLETRRAGIFFRVFVLSVIVRGGKYFALYFFLYALLAPEGYAAAELPFHKVFIGLLVPEIAASLPISGIAGIGAYQGAWVLTFRLLGFPLDVAKTTSLSHHLFTQLYGYSLGLVALIVLLSPIFLSKPLPSQRTSPQTTFDFAAKLLASLAALIGASIFLFRWTA